MTTEADFTKALMRVYFQTEECAAQIFLTCVQTPAQAKRWAKHCKDAGFDPKAVAAKAFKKEQRLLEFFNAR